jgi:hypothetical protein
LSVDKIMSRKFIFAHIGAMQPLIYRNTYYEKYLVL